MSEDLSSRAMLASLSISQWSARKQDREISDEVAVSHGVDAGVGRYQKDLFEKKHLESIRKVASEARLVHYSMTLPWGDEGTRVLPAALYFKELSAMMEFKDRFEQLCEELFDSYESKVDGEKLRLGTLWRASDFPSLEALKAKYQFRFRVLPLPSAGDVRCNLTTDEIERIKKETTEYVEESSRGAITDAWKRLYDQVKRMAQRLEEYGQPDSKSHFTDTLVSNLVELVEILPHLNITNDPALDEMAEEVRDKLCQNTPQTLRDQEEVRVQTCQRAKEIADKMAGYLS